VLARLAFPRFVGADAAVSAAERIHLAQLAHQLGLDAAEAARREGEVSARPDAARPAGA
jgi:Tfp pilus assembly protein PilX